MHLGISRRGIEDCGERNRYNEEVEVIRRIMHVDMDAFYASVEQCDNRELEGKPIIIGASRRGVVSAASYEARKYGIHSAMPVFQARRLCPQGVFLPVRMARYKEVSRDVMGTLREMSPLVEQISIDEAYLDITGTESLFGKSYSFGLNVKRAIRESTSLTCSIGIAPNKLVAKIASDFHKPDGLTLVDERDVPGFMSSLPIEKIPGIGPKTGRILRELGVILVSDVLRFPQSFWVGRLGKWGSRLYDKANGIDNSPVVAQNEPKSIGAEDTFEEDTDDISEIKKWLQWQSDSVGRSLRIHGYKGRTVTLKIKFSDFQLISRSRTLNEPTSSTQRIFNTVAQLLQEINLSRKVRLVGIGVSNLAEGPWQVKMFQEAASMKQENADIVMDEIQRRFGIGSIKRGRIFDFQP